MDPQNVENLSKQQTRSIRAEGRGSPPFCCSKHFSQIYIKKSKLLWSCSLPHHFFWNISKIEEKKNKEMNSEIKVVGIPLPHQIRIMILGSCLKSSFYFYLFLLVKLFLDDSAPFHKRCARRARSTNEEQGRITNYRHSLQERQRDDRILKTAKKTKAKQILQRRTNEQQKQLISNILSLNQ